ncbi:unnamed protein product [Pleuronectes platessa]|uniref:Uncharacterized protein n=1 Tax=Pleuronectes platessa TaxID=8262 RepID=A0A9N7YRL7_PLEPL|nr:unnamed protein product [Pleuronectes platessa]
MIKAVINCTQTNQDVERRTSSRADQAGREEEMEERWEGGCGPQTSHLLPLLPRGLQGMGTSLTSNQAPAPNAPTGPSAGLRPEFT